MAVLNVLFGLMFWVFILLMIAIVLTHRAFWVRYRQLYPERRIGQQVNPWFFRYIEGNPALRVLSTAQADPALERHRQRFVRIQWLGTALAVAIFVLFFVRIAMQGQQV